MHIDTKKLAIKIALAAKEKKATDIIVLDMQKVCGFCDYFVICSANSLRQVNAISDCILEHLAKDKIKPISRVNSNDESGWIVQDYSDVVVHIFHKPMREFYALEHLWSDAKRVRVSQKALAK